MLSEWTDSGCQKLLPCWAERVWLAVICCLGTTQATAGGRKAFAKAMSQIALQAHQSLCRSAQLLYETHLPIRVAVVLQVKLKAMVLLQHRFEVREALEAEFTVIAAHTTVSDTAKRKI